MSSYRFIGAHRGQHPVRVLCQPSARRASQWLPCVATSAGASSSRAGARLGGGTGQGLRPAPAPLRHAPAPGRLARQRLPRQAAAPARGCASTGPERAATEGIYALHDRFAQRAVLRPQPAAQSAQADPGETGTGQRHHVLAPSQ